MTLEGLDSMVYIAMDFPLWEDKNKSVAEKRIIELEQSLLR